MAWGGDSGWGGVWLRWRGVGLGWGGVGVVLNGVLVVRGLKAKDGCGWGLWLKWMRPGWMML